MQAGNAFQTIQTQDQDLNRVQSNITKSLASITGPFIGGQLIPNVSVGTSATRINTGLGRTPAVWSIADQNTLTNIARTGWDSNSITLIASSPCIISLWVN